MGSAAAPGWAPALARFGVLAAVLALAFAEVIAALAATWAGSTTFNHGFLILPISLTLVWRQRAELRRMAPRQEPWALPALLALSAGWLAGRAADVMLVQQAALVGLLIGLAVFCFGRRVAMRIAFPLGFLAFMVPVGEGLVPALQDITAEFAVALLRLAGIPVFHDGILIQTPGGLFEVAEACAGIRFLIANVVIATLFAHLAFRHWWKAAAFIALGIALPILANGLRAFGIIILAHLTDNRVAAGADHLIYGWGFFAFVMIALLLIGNLFADRAPGDFARPRDPAPAPRDGWGTEDGRGGRRGAALALAAGLAVLAGPAYGWAVIRPPPVMPPAEAVPPAVAAPWRAVAAAGAPWQPRFPHADLIVQQNYRIEDGRDGGGGPPVTLVIAYYTHQRQGAEAVHHANRFDDGTAWRRLATGRLTPGRLRPAAGAGLPAAARFDRLAGSDGPRLVVSWYWVGGHATADPVVAKLRQMLAALTGAAPAAAVIALAADYHAEPAEALAAIDAFLAAAEPLPDWLAGLAAR
jgi:exosortase A